MSTQPRAVFLSTYDLQRLDIAVRPIVHALGTPYLVGSALEETGYRDVDVRLIMADDEFDALFVGRPRLWSLLGYAVTAWLRAETGLPIDFQVQRQTEANKKYGGLSRNPLGGRDSFFAAMGDATNLISRDPKSRAAYLKRQKKPRRKAV